MKAVDGEKQTEREMESRLLRILGRDLETLKDTLHACQKACQIQTQRADFLEAENNTLRAALQTAETDLTKALSERDSVISEMYQKTNKGQNSLGASKANEEIVLQLATAKMHQAKLKEEVENLRDDYAGVNEMLKVRDREIENLNREIERLRKQSSILASKGGQVTSRTITPVKDAPSLRQVPGMERNGIKPFPGLFGLGKSAIGPKPVKAVALGERRVAGSVNSSYADATPASSRRNLNSSAVSDSKSSVKFE